MSYLFITCAEHIGGCQLLTSPGNMNINNLSMTHFLDGNIRCHLNTSGAGIVENTLVVCNNFLFLLEIIFLIIESVKNLFTITYKIKFTDYSFVCKLIDY